MEALTDLVDEAVYKELEAISERGGVLGAIDTMYQRGKIQEESMYYEHKKHDGSLPLIGVNTFLPKEHPGEVAVRNRVRAPYSLFLSRLSDSLRVTENGVRFTYSRLNLQKRGQVLRFPHESASSINSLHDF